jgi:voltage-gated potassium channel
MLKSLGATLAQVTQRLGGRDPAPTVGDTIDPFTSPTTTRAQRRRQLKTVIVLFIVFAAMVLLFSTLFHELMDREDRSYSWATSVYWTLTTMTTLGFGDITFTSDAGRLFSVVVLLAGSTFLLVMLPFVFIQFVFMPWMADRERRRAPRSVPNSTEGHIILVEWGPVEVALAERARQVGVPYVLVVDDVERAGRLHDEGHEVMVGAIDAPSTYELARVSSAAMVVATRNDQANTNIAFTVREIAPGVDIVASANSPASVDILEIAGANRVVELGEILGAAMASRTLGQAGRAHIIGGFAGLLIAEAGLVGTDLVGKTLSDAQLRARFGVGIIGVWNRGTFEIAAAGTLLQEATILLLAATSTQLAEFEEAFATSTEANLHTVIIGGGRVGRAVGRACAADGNSFTIVEQLEQRRRHGATYVIGDAADRSVLDDAGIADAAAVVITTHDDDMNVYLTRYCRGLRHDVRIVSRSRLDRNVSTLYRAGADAVLSYAATGSAAIWNHFRGDETILVSDGLSVFRTPIPSGLAGMSLAEAHVRRRTDCNVVAVERDGCLVGNPDPELPLPAEGELVLVGSDDAATKFSAEFPDHRRRVWRWRLSPSG